MNTLIVYSTKYGCTEKCAGILSEKLDGKVDLCNLKTAKPLDLSQYDKVIIGGSIYIGKIQKEVSEFCARNLDVLKKKKTGLFICCMRDGATAEAEIKDNFPKELLNNAVAKDYFGGEFIFKKMKALDRFIAKKVAKVENDISSILMERITNFAQLMNKA